MSKSSPYCWLPIEVHHGRPDLLLHWPVWWSIRTNPDIQRTTQKNVPLAYCPPCILQLQLQPTVYCRCLSPFGVFTVAVPAKKMKWSSIAR